MGEWYASGGGTSFKKWRPTSGAKSGKVRVRTTRDLYFDALFEVVEEVDRDPSRIRIDGVDGVPQEALQELLAIWAYDSRVQHRTIEEHVRFIHPQWEEDDREELCGLFRNMTVTIREAF